jgi:CheY-like chemotaxis protein/MinD-like ATPase involved in chromosome partitioning or flagellar assembly
MPAKILIIDDDLDTLKLVGVMLQRQGYEISAAADGRQGLAKALAEKPDVILLDVMMPEMDGYEVARQLRKNPQTQSTPILMFTAKTQLDDKVIGFEVGADDYLTKPTHPSELQAHVRALLDRATDQAAESPAAPQAQPGRVVGVIAPRGGLGVSTVACNLAGAFYSRTQAEVILAELTPGRGTLGMELGTPSPHGLNRLLSGKPTEINREKVESVLVAHGSGLKLLLASENPRDVSLAAQARHFAVLVPCLASMARYVVLDLGSGLPPYVEGILPVCNDRVVVTEASPNTVGQTRIMLDEITSLGIDPVSISVVLNNRMRSDTQMLWTEVQKLLGHPLASILMPAPELLMQAARLHIPAVLAEPTNATSQQILKFADEIVAQAKAK